MSTKVDVGGLALALTAESLTPEAFAPFGNVVSNPRPALHPSAAAASPSSLPPNAISANQGTAVQYRDVSAVRNLYDQAPSRDRSVPKMSIFSCAARDLAAGSGGSSRFGVHVLERHPFTTQTFTPVASSASRYLVIVAPSLEPSRDDEGLVVPLRGDGLPGRGLPDVRGLKAFVAGPHQAVTYGAGTWHAPMVVLGEPGTKLDFVVFQFASGVPDEDCQLVEFEGAGGSIDVLIPQKETAKL